MKRLKQLSKRLGWSAALIAVCSYAIFWSPQWLFLIVIEAFIVLGLLEYFNLSRQKGFPLNPYLGLAFGVLFPLPFYFLNELFILMLATLTLFVFYFRPKLKEHAFVNTALSIFGLVYVAWFFSFLAKMRVLEQGALWIFYVILIVKGGDAGAYFIGQKFGRHKLIVHISPNKSLEGSIAGLIVTILLSLASKLYLTEVPISHLLLLGIILGIVGQLGDLSESLLKRDAGI
ncbi:MAG: phosphatidate cytidylyltransferase, partial [Candidatus Omnitrophica bacterium]|nr:phosphatidate cytidylyltransferase [Candidatus Omnitrophota bacterium]